VPRTGAGEFRVAEGQDRVGAIGGTTYTVEVERGLPHEPSAVAQMVRRVLADPRGWRTVLGAELEQVGADGEADLRLLVATPGTTDELCAPLETRGRVSCRNGDLVVLNADRWTFGVPDYDGRLPAYRTYLVNHEVGHALGQGHVVCPGAGEPAPVMMQQTYGLGACAPNVWPATG
jgi:hypothetical protein